MHRDYCPERKEFHFYSKLDEWLMENGDRPIGRPNIIYTNDPDGWLETHNIDNYRPDSFMK